MARNQRDWHQEDIKAELRKQFGSLGHLSERWGLCSSAISDTLRRPNNSMRVERRIADVLRVPLHELWPARWGTDGSPLRRNIQANRNGAVNAVNRQRKVAA